MPLEFQSLAGGTTDTPTDEPRVDPDIATAGSSLAQRLRGQLEKVPNRRRDFSVPPRDVWGDDLVMVARPVSLDAQSTAVSIIEGATERILYRDEAGALVPIEAVPEAGGVGGWEGVARVAGLVNPDGPPMSIGQIITRVCGSREVLALFGDEVASWVAGRRSTAEQLLGE